MTLQDIIHFIEVGGGKRVIRYVLPVLLVLGVGILYNTRAWTNFSTPEAMDSAQLARNIATGKGYTTLFIRPLSMFLVQANNVTKQVPTDTAPDPAQVKTGHPDLANPPVYPFVLAGLMKIVPFHYPVDLKSPIWANGGNFWRYQPDFIIGIFNDVLFLASTVAVFFIGKKLFDASVARLAAILTFGCAVLWRFSASGLSTMLLLLIFLGLVWCILKIEEFARDAEPDGILILFFSVVAGILTGIGGLTRYSFGWTIIPVALFLILFSGSRKFINVIAAFVAFAIVLAPWIARNISICGAPFGTAGYAVLEGAPGFLLERSMHPVFPAMMPSFYLHKFLVNFRPIFENELMKLGGNWLSILFFAGLMLGFNRPAARRMRYFLLMCLATFIVVQALGQTGLSDQSPEINGENLLVLTAPLAFIFGTAFFFILLDQMVLPMAELRYVVIGIFVAICCLPLFFAIWFKVPTPVRYPPYYPPDIQKIAGLMNENELIMSDVPWAVAWYGQRQCAWITTDDTDEFYALNDYIKPVTGLYLTTQTMDDRLVTDCLRTGPNSWGHFVLGALSRNDIPAGFPLRHAPSGSAAISSGMFLTDADRWRIKGQ